MTKLHELLAVEKPLENQATACRAELMGTFEKKRHHFAKTIKTFTSLEENAIPVTEEQSDIQTTVSKEIKWISDKLIKAIDAGHQIDVSNTVAKQDVVLESGNILLKDVPATSLLQLEKRLGEVAQLIKAIPTLDPAKGFLLDTAAGDGIFKAREITKTRTSMVPEVISLAAATKEHKEQVQLIQKQVPIGTIQEQEWSSLITIAQKGQLLDNIEEVQRAVKKARARANETPIDVSATKIGKRVFDYIFMPVQ